MKFVKALKRFLRSRAGFTLVEMTVTVGVIAVAAAIVLPAVTGVTTTTRQTSHKADIKQLEQGVARYEADNPGQLPIQESTAPTQAVDDTNGDKIIKIRINWSATDTTGTVPTDLDVTCGTGSESLSAAVDKCFGSVDFTKLIPNYLKSEPQHMDANVTATVDTTDNDGVGDNNASTVDLKIDKCDLADDQCWFYIDGTGDIKTVMKVWNVDKNNKVLLIKESSQYGK